jgi:mycoredoxin
VDRIEIYCRPACVYCHSLKRSLARAGIAVVEHDIWKDDDARAFVRAATGGPETVPTVRVGTQALVNPTLREVVTAMTEEMPDLVPAGLQVPEPGPLQRLLRRFGSRR